MSLRNKINGIREIWSFDNRWQLISNRLFFPRESISIYRYNGLEILTDHAAGDANGAREVITSPMYRQFLSALKFDSMISLLDIGANNGGFPLLLKSEGFQLKKIVGVELNPKTYSRLRFNIERNFDCETILLNAAVSGENCEIETVLGGGSTSDSIYRSGNSAGKRVKVPGLTFDEVVSRHFGHEMIDLCKMDIEGAEFEVFGRGNVGMIGRCRYLIMEIHHGEAGNRDSILETLEAAGFQEIKRETQRGENGHLVHLFENKGL